MVKIVLVVIEAIMRRIDIMPERVTREERMVSLAIEKARKAKQELSAKKRMNIEPTQVNEFDSEVEVQKIKRPKVQDASKITNQTQDKEGYGLAGETLKKQDFRKASREFEIINKYIMFLNNTSSDEFIEAVFGEPYSKMENHRKDYVKKFMNERNSTRLWGMLDNDKRQALIDAAMKKYG